MREIYKIVGVKAIESKKVPGNLYFTYFWTSTHPEYDVQNAKILEGSSAGSELSRSDLGCHVGDEVIFQYNKGFNGQAQLVGCEIVKPAK